MYCCSCRGEGSDGVEDTGGGDDDAAQDKRDYTTGLDPLDEELDYDESMDSIEIGVYVSDEEASG